VQSEIEAALSSVCREKISVSGASRTDAGVHAYGQRASFGGDFGIPADRLTLAVNNLLGCGITGAGNGGRQPGVGRPGDLRVAETVCVHDGFHARYDAKGKKYIYRILTTPQTDVFARDAYWQMAETPDTGRMSDAARCLVGRMDFRAFQAAGGAPRETTVRTVYGIDIGTAPAGRDGRVTVIEVKGDGFLYNMVRIIVGTLVMAGIGRMSADDVKRAAESLDRRNAGPTAPPQGLYLAEVYY
jgi:tRNA pseudouridine38-40 synthase